LKLSGVSVCPGRVLSQSYLLVTVPEFDLEAKEPGLNAEQANRCIDEAVAQVVTQLGQTKKRFENNRDLADLLDVQESMVTDPTFLEDIKANVAAGYGPAIAVMRAAKVQEDMLRSLDDNFMALRAEDVHDVSSRTACRILGLEYPDISNLPGPVVLIGEDLLPSMLLNADMEYLAGIVTEGGTRTSHVSILASSMEIPMIVGCGGAREAGGGVPVYLDAGAGSFEYGFPPEDESKYAAKVRSFLAERGELLKLAGQEALSAEGERIQLFANIIEPASLGKVLEYGMDGVGLFRTEFLYMNRSKPPTEDEQFTVYKMAAEKVQGKPVIIRTMDIGGDKGVECLDLPKEDNPFMGFRAVRIGMAYPEIMITQLRAILRAGAFGNVRVMFPMIAASVELEAVLGMLEKAKKELDAEGIPFDAGIKVGIMVEIPSAVIMLDHFVKGLDFVSIGSNDLIQYTFAVDRLNKKVEYLYNSMDPAVLRLIKHTIDTADKAGIECSLCGEMAGDILGMAVLMALGLKKYSISTSLALAAKKRLSLLGAGALAKAGEQILAARDAGEVTAIIRANLPQDYA
jgi:phosphotransferase system enzyme I (PtsI)